MGSTIQKRISINYACSPPLLRASLAASVARCHNLSGGCLVAPAVEYDSFQGGLLSLCCGSVTWRKCFQSRIAAVDGFFAILDRWRRVWNWWMLRWKGTSRSRIAGTMFLAVEKRCSWLKSAFVLLMVLATHLRNRNQRNEWSGCGFVRHGRSIVESLIVNNLNNK